MGLPYTIRTDASGRDVVCGFAEQQKLMQARYDGWYPRLVKIHETGQALLLARPGTTKQRWVPRASVTFMRDDGTDVREDRPGRAGRNGERPRIYPAARYHVADWLRAVLVKDGILDQ